MKRSFEDARILVVGGASGIGASLVKMFRGMGAQVLIIDRTALPLDSMALQADVADPNQAKASIDSAIQRVGYFDYLINAAGVFMGGEIRDTPLHHWKTVLDNNLYAVLNVSQLTYEHMLTRGSGHIVNIASTAGLIPVPAMGIYGASKYALVGFSHALRNEASAFGIKVSVACPTIVDTPLYETAIYNKLETKKLLKSRARLQTADEAAQAIIKGIIRNKRTIHTSFVTVAITKLHAVAPFLFDLGARRVMRTYRDKVRSPQAP